MSMKNPLTPAGIEPATFRIVAQHTHIVADRYVVNNLKMANTQGRNM